MKKLLFFALLFVVSIANCKNYDDLEQDLPQKTADVKKLIEELDDHIYENVKNFDKNLEWMDVYRDRMCGYYDSMNLGSKEISQYAKVDSIFQFLYHESNLKQMPMLQYYNGEFYKLIFSFLNRVGRTPFCRP